MLSLAATVQYSWLQLAQTNQLVQYSYISPKIENTSSVLLAVGTNPGFHIIDFDLPIGDEGGGHIHAGGNPAVSNDR